MFDTDIMIMVCFSLQMTQNMNKKEGIVTIGADGKYHTLHTVLLNMLTVEYQTHSIFLGL
jgi:hypothetical protein